MGRQAKKKLKALFSSAHALYFVSDRAGALISLAKDKFETTSVADLFHLKQCINNLLCLALGRRLALAGSAFDAAKETCTEICPEEAAYAEQLFTANYTLRAFKTLATASTPIMGGIRPTAASVPSNALKQSLIR